MQSVFSKVTLLSTLLALCVQAQGLPFYFDPLGNIGGAKKLYTLVSTGTQYINTGITGTGDSRVLAEITPMSTSQAFLFGSRIGIENQAFGFMQSSSGTTTFRDDYNDSISPNFGDCRTNVFYTIDKNNGLVSVYNADGTLNSTNSIANATFDNGFGVFIFSLNTSGNPTVTGAAKCRTFKLYKAGVLMFSGIPVPAGDTQYSSTPAPSNCMFDNVSKTYFVNQGTGSFGIEEVK